MYTGIGMHGAPPIYDYTFRLTEAVEVIPDHVYDHRIFGYFFGIFAEI
jgi:hypothetical protein